MKKNIYYFCLVASLIFIVGCGGKNTSNSLNKEQIEDKVSVQFEGINGRGQARIENNLDSPLNTLTFDIKDNGYLKNGKNVTLSLDNDQKQKLKEKGYTLSDNFSPTFKVTGLDEVAEKANDIRNLKEIENQINEDVNERYSDYGENQSWGTHYEISLYKMMYCPYNLYEPTEDEKNAIFSNFYNDGSLVGIYTVTSYTNDETMEIKSEDIAIIGYSKLILDKSNTADVDNNNAIFTPRNNNPSIDSVLEELEGFGYKLVDDE